MHPQIYHSHAYSFFVTMSVFPIDPPYTYCAGGFLICPFLLSIKPLCCSLNLKH